MEPIVNGEILEDFEQNDPDSEGERVVRVGKLALEQLETRLLNESSSKRKMSPSLLVKIIKTTSKVIAEAEATRARRAEIELKVLELKYRRPPTGDAQPLERIAEFSELVRQFDPQVLRTFALMAMGSVSEAEFTEMMERQVGQNGQNGH